jgi:hypothetical protein
MIKNVVYLPTELEIQPLCDFRVFEEPGIIVHEMRETEEVAGAGAEIA